MRSFLLASVAAALALASPVPQSLDLGLIDSIATPDNVTIPSDITAQVVSYDSDSAVAAVETSVLSSDSTVDLSDASDIVNTTAVLKKRTACAAQPTGYGPVASPDTAAGFLAYAAYASAAKAAPTPSGYSQTFSNLNASNK